MIPGEQAVSGDLLPGAEMAELLETKFELLVKVKRARSIQNYKIHLDNKDEQDRRVFQ